MKEIKLFNSKYFAETRCDPNEAIKSNGDCASCTISGCLKCQFKIDDSTLECLPGFCAQGYTEHNGNCIR